MSKVAAVKSPHAGHRQRLRLKMLETGGEGLADYELLEFLLFQAYPRADTKPKAKELIKTIGSFSAVLASTPDELRNVGLSETAIGAIKIAEISARRLAKAQLISKPIMASWDRLIEWCRMELGHRKVEEFHLLFLDKKNTLIAHEPQNKGTVDHTPVYVREVVKRTLELNASAIIMVHNHPSGDPTPSKADIQMTKLVHEALSKLNIQLHDHLIIGLSGHTSFKSSGLL
ncbi:MAG: RadC family protein [Alphaproteobacteria bacterium]